MVMCYATIGPRHTQLILRNAVISTTARVAGVLPLLS